MSYTGKIFKRTPGDNVNSPNSFSYFWQDSQSIVPKQAFHKTIAAKAHGSNFVVFNFLENGDFFLKSVE